MPRKTLLRRALGLTSALVIVGSGVLAAPAQATAPDGWPDAFAPWPVCADEEAQYCVENATIGVDGGDAPLFLLGLTAEVMSVSDDAFVWSVVPADENEDEDEDENPDEGDIASEDDTTPDGEIRLVIRTGQFTTGISGAVAKGLRITNSMVGENRTMTITGQFVDTDQLADDVECDAECGDRDTMADEDNSYEAFAGWTFAPDEEWAALDGAYIASDATTLGEPEFDSESLNWSVALSNPHLDSDGNASRGSFNAYLPPGYFSAHGTAHTPAAFAGYDVVVGDEEDGVSVPVTVGFQDGGLTFDVPDLPYDGVTEVHVFNRPSTANPDATVPGQPQGVEADRGSNIDVSWVEPMEDGGLDITGYTARAFTAATKGAVAGSCVTDGTSCTITGLNPTTTYYIAASATNALGEGPGTASRVTSTPTLPLAPRGLTVAPRNGTLAAAWVAPLANNTGFVTGYTARAYTVASGGIPVRSCTTTRPSSVVEAPKTCALTGLANGVRYYVAVTAANSAGSGPATTRLAAIPRTVTSAPRSPSATSAARKVRVAWAPPSILGGAPVTGYTAALYTAPSGGAVAARCAAAAAGRACTTGLLTPGKVYYASIQATNAAGLSPASARVKVLVRR